MAHFYGPHGELHAFVDYAGQREGQRPATLADARKYGWLPSVTTVLNDLNKEQLNKWRVEQAIRAALPMAATMPEPEIIATVVKQSEEYRDWAAGFGSEVHNGICAAIQQGRGRIRAPALLGVDEIVDGFLDWADANALVVNESELSFSSSLGWAGTIDGLGTFWGEPGLFDWKTQDFTEPSGRNGPQLRDPEWPLQMAGYCVGLESCLSWYGVSTTEMNRVSFIISRTIPGLVVAHQWQDSDRYDAGWLALFETWCAIHRWGKWAKKPTLELLQGGLDI